MKRRQNARAVVASKAMIQALRAFVLEGVAPPPVVEALLLRDLDEAARRATKTVLALGVLPEVSAIVDEVIPAGMFHDPEDLARWRGHQGLKGAPDEDRMALVLVSNWWETARRGARNVS